MSSGVKTLNQNERTDSLMIEFQAFAMESGTCSKAFCVFCLLKQKKRGREGVWTANQITAFKILKLVSS